MKNYFFLTLLIISSCSDIPEDQNFDSVEIIETVVLPKIINETSGLEILNEVFITHNDSGGEPSLYFFNLNGEIINSKEALNAIGLKPLELEARDGLALINGSNVLTA